MQGSIHSNNFGFLRLFFATLVIVSHVPEALDGNRNREYLVRFFGSMSLGDLAVDCFFLISGYLILMSYQNSSSLTSYFSKRILRIYPGYLLAYILTLIVVIPLAQGLSFLMQFDTWFWFKSVVRMFVLDVPWAEGVFDKTPIPYLNGSMWTIKYEFLCYGMVPVLFYFFKENLKYYVLTLLILVSTSYMAAYADFDIGIPTPVSLQLSSATRLLPFFIMGSIFYLMRHRIQYKAHYMVMCVAGLFVMFFDPHLAPLALMTMGAYLLFGFAFHYKSQALSQVGTKVDLSYGIYLFAWPIQNLIIQHFPSITTIPLTLLVIVLSAAVAYLSWTFVEKPFMQMKKKYNKASN